MVENPDFVDKFCNEWKPFSSLRESHDFRCSQYAKMLTISDDDYNDVCCCLTDANRFKNVDY